MSLRLSSNRLLRVSRRTICCWIKTSRRETSFWVLAWSCCAWARSLVSAAIRSVRRTDLRGCWCWESKSLLSWVLSWVVFCCSALYSLLLFHLVFESLVGYRDVAGDLVDAKVLVQVFKVILLGPAIKHQKNNLRGWSLAIIGQDADLDGALLGISGPHQELAHLGVFGPVLLEVFEAVNPLVLRVVARAFHRVLARRLLWVPGAGLEILFPGDEVIVGCRHRLGEDLLAENAPVHDAGHHRVSGQTHGLSKAWQHGGKTLAHVLIVIRAFQIHRLAGGGVKKVRVQHFVGPSNASAPALEHVLHPGIMLCVRIKIEVARLRCAHWALKLSSCETVEPEASWVNWLRWGNRLRNVRPKSRRRSSKSSSLVCSILTAPSSNVASHCLSSQPLAATSFSIPDNAALKSNTPR